MNVERIAKFEKKRDFFFSLYEILEVSSSSQKQKKKQKEKELEEVIILKCLICLGMLLGVEIILRE